MRAARNLGRFKVTFDGAQFGGGEVTKDGKPFRGWPVPEPHDS